MKTKKEMLVYAQAAKMLRSVAHPTRIEIIELLVKAGSLTVNEIKSQLETTQSMTSQHLGVLKNAGIVNCDKEANTCHYYICNKHVLKLLECVDRCARTQVQ
ncbi:MAG: metalloregulator ArsR/SmtB family transcription factor [Candidatus Omnitrophica bacterium]|nr:metalloregulator ArsR/SmtB family transcription factor [Candidatus Omnitrophota bacterium]